MSVDSWYNHVIIAMHKDKGSLYYSCEEGRNRKILDNGVSSSKYDCCGLFVHNVHKCVSSLQVVA